MPKEKEGLGSQRAQGMEGERDEGEEECGRRNRCTMGGTILESLCHPTPARIKEFV